MPWTLLSERVAGMDAPVLMDIDQHAALPFPRSLPEFQRLFPDDSSCAQYLEMARWGDGFVCRHCGVTGEFFRIAPRRTSEKMGAMRGAFGWRSPLTEAP